MAELPILKKKDAYYVHLKVPQKSDPLATIFLESSLDGIDWDIVGLRPAVEGSIQIIPVTSGLTFKFRTQEDFGDFLDPSDEITVVISDIVPPPSIPEVVDTFSSSVHLRLGELKAPISTGHIVQSTDSGATWVKSTQTVSGDLIVVKTKSNTDYLFMTREVPTESLWLKKYSLDSVAVKTSEIEDPDLPWDVILTDAYGLSLTMPDYGEGVTNFDLYVQVGANLNSEPLGFKRVAESDKAYGRARISVSWKDYYTALKIRSLGSGSFKEKIVPIPPVTRPILSSKKGSGYIDLVWSGVESKPVEDATGITNGRVLVYRKKAPDTTYNLIANSSKIDSKGFRDSPPTENGVYPDYNYYVSVEAGIQETGGYRVGQPHDEGTKGNYIRGFSDSTPLTTKPNVGTYTGSVGFFSGESLDLPDYGNVGECIPSIPPTPSYFNVTANTLDSTSPTESVCVDYYIHELRPIDNQGNPTGDWFRAKCYEAKQNGLLLEEIPPKTTVTIKEVLSGSYYEGRWVAIKD